jgi:hypothetical protein
MSQEATIPNHGLKLDTREAANETSIPRTERTTPEMSVSVLAKVKQSLSEHIKDWHSKLLKALEGDHEFHKYLGL